VSEETARLLDETWDVVESPQFAAAYNASVGRSFDVLVGQLQQTVFTNTGGSSPVGRPLPSLLVHVKPSKTIFLIDDSDRSVHADATSALLEVAALSDAVFDSIEEELR